MFERKTRSQLLYNKIHDVLCVLPVQLINYYTKNEVVEPERADDGHMRNAKVVFSK